jgi:hypothetical protein
MPHLIHSTGTFESIYFNFRIIPIHVSEIQIRNYFQKYIEYKIPPENDKFKNTYTIK